MANNGNHRGGKKSSSPPAKARAAAAAGTPSIMSFMKFNPAKVAREMAGGGSGRSSNNNSKSSTAAAAPAPPATDDDSPSAKIARARAGIRTIATPSSARRARSNGRGSPSKKSRKSSKVSSSSSPTHRRVSAAGSSNNSRKKSDTGNNTGGVVGTGNEKQHRKEAVVDLSMDASEEDDNVNNDESFETAREEEEKEDAADTSSPPSAVGGSMSSGGKKRKKQQQQLQQSIIDIDDDDGAENRINGSEDSTLAKQMEKRSRRRREQQKQEQQQQSKKGDVITLTSSREDEGDEDDDSDVEIVPPGGKRRRGGTVSKEKVNGKSNGSSNNSNSAKKPSVPSSSSKSTGAGRAAAANVDSSDVDVVPPPSAAATTTASTSETRPAIAASSAAAAAKKRPPPSSFSTSSERRPKMFAAASPAAAASTAHAHSSSSSSSQQLQPQLKRPSPDTHGLALVRIADVRTAPTKSQLDLNPEACRKTTIYPMRPSLILGRTGLQGKPTNNKIDLGIGVDADGVSRRQVRVKVVSVEGNVDGRRGRHRPSIRAKVFDPDHGSIYVGVGHNGPCGGTGAPAYKYEIYRQGVEFVLKVGDAIAFDAYNASSHGSPKGEGTRPLHVFRLVRYDLRGLPPTASPTAAAAASNTVSASIPAAAAATAAAATATATATSLAEEAMPKPQAPRESRNDNDPIDKTVLRPGGVMSSSQSSTARQKKQSAHEAGEGKKRNEIGNTKKYSPNANVKERKDLNKADDARGTERKEHVDVSSPVCGPASTPAKSSPSNISIAKNDTVQKPMVQPETPKIVRGDDKATTDPKTSRGDDKATKDPKSVDVVHADVVKNEDNALKPPQQPAVGDRFRVQFDNVSNFFGLKEACQWFCGTADDVGSASKHKFEVNIRFDDREIRWCTYPSNDIERLLDKDGASAATAAALQEAESQGRSRRRTKTDGDDQSSDRSEATVYPEGSLSNGSFPSEAAVFDPNPSELFVGDLVDCHYQNGGSNGEWYRGRVARVHAATAAVSGQPTSTLFDVGYNDGFYERDIPLQRGNLRLFQRGSDDYSWLFGAHLSTSTSTGRNKTTRRGIVMGSVMKNSTKVTVKFDDGSSEERNVTEVADELFLAQLERTPKERIMSWPTTTRGRAQEEPTQEEKLGLKRRVKVESPESNLPDVSSLAKKQKGDEKANLDAEDDDEGPMGTEKQTDHRRREVFSSTQIDELLNAPQESQCSQDSYLDSPERVGNKPRAKEMHSSLANALWNSLNSAEPHNSSLLLRHSSVFHHTLPNSALSQKLFNLMKKGPQSEGFTFRDPNRMELAYDYVRLSLATSAELEKGPNFPSFGPSSWADVQHFLDQPLQETARMGSFYSIRESDSASSMRRLGEALQVAARGLSCIDELLKSGLKDAKEEGTTCNPRRLYAANPTTRAVLDNNVRESLKYAVRCAAQCWVRHGHFIVGDGEDLPPAVSSDEDWCATEAKQCLDSLGSIVSHLAWLYCAEEGLDMGDNDCAFVINDALGAEFEKLHQDGSDFGFLGKKKPSIATWKKFSRRAKLWFILSVDTTFASPLRTNLAKLMHMTKDMKVIGGLT